MTSLKLKLLGGAFLMAATGMAGTASATEIHGGGATLPAPAPSYRCHLPANGGPGVTPRTITGGSPARPA